MTATRYLVSTDAGTLTGLCNGSNVDFALNPAHSVVASSLMMLINNTPTDCSVVPGYLRLASPPSFGDSVFAWFITEEEASSGTGVSALNIVQDAMTEIGALPQGQVPSANDQNWGLSKLNDLLDSWNADNLFTYYTDDIQHLIITPVASYTIGPSAADIISPRPKKILSANWINADGSRRPLKIIESSDYSEIYNPITTSSVPGRLYFKPTFPNGTIFLYPVNTVAGTLEIFSEHLLSLFATLATVYALPPGYKKALTLSLAEDIGPSFGVTLSAQLAHQANIARLKIRSANVTIPKMRSDLPVNYNHRGCDYRRIFR